MLQRRRGAPFDTLDAPQTARDTPLPTTRRTMLGSGRAPPSGHELASADDVAERLAMHMCERSDVSLHANAGHSVERAIGHGPPSLCATSTGSAGVMEACSSEAPLRSVLVGRVSDEWLPMPALASSTSNGCSKRSIGTRVSLSEQLKQPLRVMRVFGFAPFLLGNNAPWLHRSEKLVLFLWTLASAAFNL